MADTGKLAVRGYGAGAVKYAALRGYVPNPPSTTLNGCLVTRGFGIANTHKKALRGFVANPGGGGGGSGSFYIFGGAWVR